MAEYCLECASKILGLTDKQQKQAMLTDEPELCEGCGKLKRTVVVIKDREYRKNRLESALRGLLK